MITTLFQLPRNYLKILFVLFLGIATTPTQAVISFDGMSSVPIFESRHGKLKQSTGSWRGNRDTHQNLAKQGKEKKWHKDDVVSDGAENYKPPRFRKVK